MLLSLNLDINCLLYDFCCNALEDMQIRSSHNAYSVWRTIKSYSTLIRFDTNCAYSDMISEILKGLCTPST